jgi:hypothetical protein
MRQHLNDRHPNWQDATDQAMCALIEKIKISLKEEEDLKVPEINQGRYGTPLEQRDQRRMNYTAEVRGDSPRRPRSQNFSVHPPIQPISFGSAGQLLGRQNAAGPMQGISSTSTDPFG